MPATDDDFTEIEQGAWGGLLGLHARMMRLIEADLDATAFRVAQTIGCGFFRWFGRGDPAAGERQRAEQLSRTCARSHWCGEAKLLE